MRRCFRASLSLLVVASTAYACSTDYSVASGPSDAATTDASHDVGSSSAEDGSGGSVVDVVGDHASSLPECTAQRVIHLVAGTGGLAHFTQIWPVPAVITSYTNVYAFDDPNVALSGPGSSAQHPLYVRAFAPAVPVWLATGSYPMPTAFVTGSNQTHTATPVQTSAGGISAIAVGASQQSKLASPLVELTLAHSGLYMSNNGNPPETFAATIDAAITTLRGVTTITAATEMELRPDDKLIETWLGTTTATLRLPLLDLARNLLFASNLLRLGLVSTVVMPAFNDDPDNYFVDMTAPASTESDLLAKLLHNVFARLAASTEPACSHGGATLSLGDNTVFVVSGDTPKNPFERSGWPDGTPDNSNWIYVRSNGWLIPGWFGQVTPNNAFTFDPTTGVTTGVTTGGADAGATLADEYATVLGLLYAITRGNKTYLSTLGSQPYIGVVSPTNP